LVRQAHHREETYSKYAEGVQVKTVSELEAAHTRRSSLVSRISPVESGGSFDRSLRSAFGLGRDDKKVALLVGMTGVPSALQIGRGFNLLFSIDYLLL